MKNKSLIQKIFLLTLSLLSTGSLFGKTLTRDLKNEADFSSGLVAWYPFDGDASDASSKIGRATSELQSHSDLVCRLLLEKKKKEKKDKEKKKKNRHMTDM